MAAVDLLSTPGLRRHGGAVWAQVAKICHRHGWNSDGFIAHIESESGWHPRARNPTSTASGLIQWIDPTARALHGVSSAEILELPVSRQLELAEDYFARYERRHPMGPWDFALAGLGTGRLPPGPIADDAVLYEPGSPGALANSTLCDADGAMRAGALRRRLEGIARRLGSAPRLLVDVDLSDETPHARTIPAPPPAPAVGGAGDSTFRFGGGAPIPTSIGSAPVDRPCGEVVTLLGELGRAVGELSVRVDALIGDVRELRDAIAHVADSQVEVVTRLDRAIPRTLPPRAGAATPAGEAVCSGAG